MTVPDQIADAFTAAFGQYTADDVGIRFNCAEVDALADLLTALRRPDLAAAWVEAHAEDDDAGDAHYRG